MVAAASPAMAGAGAQREAGEDAAAEWDSLADENDDAPMVDSPSIASDWPDDEGSGQRDDADWASMARDDLEDADDARPRGRSWYSKLLMPLASWPAAGKPSLSTACAAMGALVLALVIWRADVVRLLPQTAAFYRLVGLEVNVRGLMFKDVKISSETVEGKAVLVIEGAITGKGAKPVELPRLRFSVRDAQGAEIYAWNAVLEKAVLNPGERAWFKSRLASPPAEGRDIDVRFFNKRDLAGGRA